MKLSEYQREVERIKRLEGSEEAVGAANRIVEALEADKDIRREEAYRIWLEAACAVAPFARPEIIEHELL